MNEWHRILKWARERIPSVLDELIAALIIVVLGSLVIYFRQNVVPFVNQLLTKPNPYFIALLLAIGVSVALIYFIRRKRMLTWSLVNIPKDDEFDDFWLEIKSVLQTMGWHIEGENTQGINFVVKEEGSYVQKRIAVMLEPQKDLELTRANTVAIVHTLKKAKFDLGYYIARSPRAYFENRKIKTVAKDYIKFTSYQDFALNGANFGGYLQHLMSDWENSRVAKIYVDVAGRDEEGQLHQPLESLLDDLFSHLGSGMRVALLGDFGCGKTTFLKHYAYILARRHRQNPISNPIPILIHLRDYELVDNLEQLITRELAKYGVFAGLEVIKNPLQKRKIILMLDAFDEMTLAVDRLSIQRNLRQIESTIPEMSFVVSCRTHFFRDKVEESQLQAFFTVYLEHWGKIQLIGYLQKSIGDHWKGTLDLIKNTYNLGELAKTPLFLEMIVGSLGNIPQQHMRSAELYGIYTGQWLDSQMHKAVLDRDRKTKFMEDLAWQMVKEGRRFIPWAELRNLIQEQYGLSITQVDSFDNDIRTCSFLNRSSEGTGYTFIHSSFMEYFVACRLAREVKANRIEDLCEVELSIEIMSFTAQLLDIPVYYERFHLWLEFKVEPKFALARRNIAHILRIISRGPLPPEGVDLQLKTSQLIYLALNAQTTQSRWKALVTLGWLRSGEAIKVARSLLISEVETDIRLLRISALILGLLGVTSTIDAIVNQLFVAKDFSLRQNCAVALGFMGDVNAVPKLVKALEMEDDYRVRRSAIWAIETIDPILAAKALSDRALNDPDEEVRQYATLAIGRIGGELALNMLEDVLLDPSPLVRKSAVESIGRIGGEKALELIDSVLNDLDPSVREASEYALNLIKT